MMKLYIKKSICLVTAMVCFMLGTGCSNNDTPDVTGVTYTTLDSTTPPPVLTEPTTVTSTITSEDTSDTGDSITSHTGEQSSSQTQSDASSQPSQTTTSVTTPKTTTQTTTTTTTPTSTTPPPVSGNYPVNSYKALNYSEVKGVWISYLEFNSLLLGKSKSEFQSTVRSMLDKVSEKGLNTVYLHVRSHGDAYYNSSLFPWSSYVTGTFGKNPGFDPLSIFIEEAHARNLSIHAWINPMRGYTTAELNKMADTYPAKQWYNDPKKKGTYIVEVSGRWYLNPAYNEVLKLICDGAAEIVSNYNVDGIHIDDYFYPTTDASFDAAAFKASGYSNVSAFRIANVDKLVKGLYDTVNSASSTALFGVSPTGSISYNLNTQYADVKKWCSQKGYLDYILPQLYYGFKNSTEPFTECLAKWEAMIVPSDIKLIVGLAVYKVGEEDTWAGAGKNEWKTDTEILKRQYQTAKKTESYGGIALYRYENIFGNLGDRTKVTNEINALVSVMKS